MSKLLLFGGSGLVGSRVVELLDKEFEIIAPSHFEVDLNSDEQILQVLEDIKPEQILYAAGFTNVDLAEKKRDETYQLNVNAPKLIAEKAAVLGTPFYYISTDYVFDGKKTDSPYTEDDVPNPVDSVYAKSKYEGEKVTLSASDKNMVLRIIMPFSVSFTKKFDLVRLVIDKLKKGEKLVGIVDQKINPIFVDDLVNALGKILRLRKSGIYHLGATDFTTPFEYMKSIARTFGLQEELIEETTFADYSPTRPARRPQNTWLDTKKFRSEFGEGVLHTIDEELNLLRSKNLFIGKAKNLFIAKQELVHLKKD